MEEIDDIVLKWSRITLVLLWPTIHWLLLQVRGHGHASSPLRVASTHDLLSHAHSEQLLVQASVIKITLTLFLPHPSYQFKLAAAGNGISDSNMPYEHH